MFLQEQSLPEVPLAPSQGATSERQQVPRGPAAFALPGWGGQESAWAPRSQQPAPHSCLPMQSRAASVSHTFLSVALGEPLGSWSSLSTLPAFLPGEARKDEPSCGIFPSGTSPLGTLGRQEKPLSDSDCCSFFPTFPAYCHPARSSGCSVCIL